MTPPDDRAPASERLPNQSAADVAGKEASLVMASDIWGPGQAGDRAASSASGTNNAKDQPALRLTMQNGASTAEGFVPDLQLVDGRHLVTRATHQFARAHQGLTQDAGSPLKPHLVLAVRDLARATENQTEQQISKPVLIFRTTPGQDTDSQDALVRQSSSRNQMDELARLTLQGNRSGDDLLRHLINGDSFTRYLAQDDYVYSAFKHLAQRPEYQEQMRAAALRSYSKHDDSEILRTIHDIALSDKQMGQALKAYASSGLRSDSEARRTSAEKLLNAMPELWNANDALLAAKNVTPESIQSFRGAMARVPEPVRHEVMLHMLTAIGPGGLETREQKLYAALLTPQSNHFAGQKNFDPLSMSGETPRFPFTSSPENRPHRDLIRELWPGYELSTFPGGRHYGDANQDTRYLQASSFLPRTASSLAGAAVLEKWHVAEGTLEQKARVEGVLKRYDDQTLQSIDNRIALYNALSPDMRQELTGQNEPLDARQIFGKLANDTINDKTSADFSFLLDAKPPAKSLEQRLDDKLALLEHKVGDATARLNQLTQNSQHVFTDLTKHAEGGVGFMNRLDQIASKADLLTSPLTPFTPRLEISPEGSIVIRPLPLLQPREDGVERWSKEQSARVHDFVASNKDVKVALGDLSASSAALTKLELGRDAFQHSALTNAGQSDMADLFAVNMLDRYGLEALKQSARPVYDQLTQPHGILQRLHAEGLTGATVVQDHDPKSKNCFKESLQDLQQMKFDPARGNLELDALRKNALQSLDQDPTLSKMTNIARTFNSELPQLSKLFDAGVQGSKFDDYIGLVREHTDELEKTLKSFTPADVIDLKSKLANIDAACDQCKDDQARSELLNRKEAMTKMLEVIDPSSDQHKQLEKMFDQIKSRDFRADTLGNWARDNGPVIAATLVATGVTVASMGTASPLAVVLVSSAVAFGASQSTKELLYLTNHYIGDTGLGRLDERSYMGAWTEKSVHRLEAAIEKFSDDGVREGLKALTSAEKEMMKDYLKEVLEPSLIEYGTDVALSLATVGLVKFAGEGIKGFSRAGLKSLITSPETGQLLTQIDRASGIAAKDAASKEFVSSWLSTMKDTGKRLAHDGAAAAVQEGGSRLAEDALKDIKMQNSMAGFVVSTALAMAQAKFSHGHSRRSAAHFSDANNVHFHPEVRTDVLERLRLDGHTVVEHPGGLVEVTPFNAEQGMKPIQLHFDGQSSQDVVEHPAAKARPAEPSEAAGAGNSKPQSGHEEGAKASRENERRSFIEDRQRMAAKLDGETGQSSKHYDAGIEQPHAAPSFALQLKGEEGMTWAEYSQARASQISAQIDQLKGTAGADKSEIARLEAEKNAYENKGDYKRNTELQTEFRDKIQSSVLEGVQKRERIESQKMEWEPSEKSLEIRREMQSFTREFMAGNYEKAYQLARHSKTAPGHETAYPQNDPKHPLTPIKARDLLSATADHNPKLEEHLRNMEQTGKAHILPFEDGKPKEYLVTELPTIIELETGAKVDLLDKSGNTFSQTGAPGRLLTAEERAEMQTVRESAAAKRIFAEYAMQAFEERLVHLNQFNEGAILSPTYAKYVERYATHSRADDLFNVGNQIPNNGLDDVLGTGRSRRTIEQEVPMLLYDSGMPLEIISREMEKNYPYRKEVLDFLRDQEAHKVATP
jgi:hypothetical protein